jgi:hypothetical protein
MALEMTQFEQRWSEQVNAKVESPLGNEPIVAVEQTHKRVHDLLVGKF